MKKQLLTLTIPAIIGLSNFVSAQTPAWQWAKSAGGISNDYSTSVISDASGNLIVVGNFESPSIIFGSTTLTNVDSDYYSDMFIVKYDQAGTVLWAKSAGGIDNDFANSVTVDVSGNLIVTGVFSHNITFDSITLINTGYADMFIVKYDPTGNVLWAKSAVGSWLDVGWSVTADALGDLIVVGRFDSSPLIFGNFILNNSGSSNMFIVKYDQTGTVLWAKSSGGSLHAYANSVTTDATGNLIVSGTFNSPTITFGSTTLAHQGTLGNYDMFIVKYDQAGNVLWAKSVGGSGTDAASSVTADASGDLIVTGFYMSPTITFDSTSMTNAGYEDMFIVKYDATGTVQWAKSAGGNYSDYVLSVTADSTGNIFVAGYFDSPTITFDSNTLTNIGGHNMFVVKYNLTGTLLWATSAVGTAAANSVIADSWGNIIVAGEFFSSSITFGSITLTSPGGDDMFIAKLNGTTGVENSESNQEISVYPNPNNGNFTLQTPDVIPYSIKIYNPLGETIYEEEKIFSQKKAINISGQPNGIYITELRSKTKVIRDKIVVQH